MNFAAAPRRPRGESIVPMINVVFLLLIFFLMTAEIAPPEPFEVTPPEAVGEEAELQPGTLYLGADGQIAYEDARGDAALTALAAHPARMPLTIRADAALPAADMARLLPRITALGITDIQLVTGAK